MALPKHQISWSQANASPLWGELLVSLKKKGCLNFSAILAKLCVMDCVGFKTWIDPHSYSGGCSRVANLTQPTSFCLSVVTRSNSVYSFFVVVNPSFKFNCTLKLSDTTTGEYLLSLLLRGSIIVQLISCFTSLDSNKFLILHKQSNRIQTSQTGCQPYSDTSPY